MKEFKYDIIQLIELVEERPCLWDKSLESYKDRLDRRSAWEEIFHLMDERYEAMPPEEKRITGEHILNKWTNVRDTFVKTLKTKMGRPRKRYILHEHLKFLTKNVPEDECSVEYAPEVSTYMKQEYERERGTRRSRKKTKKINTDDSSTDNESNSSSHVPKKSKKDRSSARSETPKRDYSDINLKSDVADIDFIEVDTSHGANEPRLMNEDEAFFASLLPTVARYSEDERLEFRLEVLGVMKRIKDKRNWSVDDNA